MKNKIPKEPLKNVVSSRNLHTSSEKHELATKTYQEKIRRGAMSVLQPKCANCSSKHVFQRFPIGIIGGKGKMGGIFGNIFQKNGYEVLIADTKTKLKNEDIIKKAKVILIAVPIRTTKNVIKKIVQKMKSNQLLLDVTSIKAPIIEEMLKGKSAVIGLHPMFNDTTFGPGQTIILCPARPKNWLPWLTNIFQQEQLIMETLTPEKHDDIMTIVQGLVHFAEIAFIEALRDFGMKMPSVISYAGPASKLKMNFAARILAQNPDLYASIQIENSKNVNIQKTYIEALKRLSEIVEKKDYKKFQEYFKKGKEFLGAFAQESMMETDWVIAQCLGKIVRSSQKPYKPKTAHLVAILGPKKTFTDGASERWMKERRIEHFGKYYLPDIGSVFHAVENDEAEFGIVPLENSIHGTVRETIDSLFRSKGEIVEALKIPIHHYLGVLPGVKVEEVKRVMSHPQVRYQCDRFLKKKGFDFEARLSSVAAMEQVKRLKQHDTGVIGSKGALQENGFEIVAEKIENDPSNATTFIVISKKPFSGKSMNGKPITSMVFHFSKNKFGSLAKVFNEFAERGINLSRIESRPSGEKFGNYLFFLDCEGKREEPKVREAIRATKKHVAFLKILGSYRLHG